MSRSGYSDDGDEWAMIRWRGAVKKAVNGRRGQAFLQELLTALDALKVKRLIAYDLIADGEVCALGALGLARNLDMTAFDHEVDKDIADAFGIAPALASEVMYVNDDAYGYRCSPEHRFNMMRKWVSGQIKP